MSTTEIPQEVRDMLADMGMRHPLDSDHSERAAGMAVQHDRMARAFDRAGDARNAAAARRLAAKARA